jgi:hypothetical protein
MFLEKQRNCLPLVVILLNCFVTHWTVKPRVRPEHLTAELGYIDSGDFVGQTSFSFVKLRTVVSDNILTTD